MLRARFAPPPADPPVAQQPDQPGDDKPPVKDPGDDQPGDDQPGDDQPGDDQPGDAPADPEEVDKPKAVAVKQEWISLGSIDPSSPYRMLVTLNNKGASVERIELNSTTYRDLDTDHGYLGHLVLIDQKGDKGCLVNAVGPGTPAAKAVIEKDGSTGLKVGDIITKIGDAPVHMQADLTKWLKQSKRDQQVEVAFKREIKGKREDFIATVKLGELPLQLVGPETTKAAKDEDGKEGKLRVHPQSFLLTLEQLGNQTIASNKEEIAGLPSLYTENWTLVKKSLNSVSFSLEIPSKTGTLEVIKRYTLAKLPAEHNEKKDFAQGYHLELDIEIHNRGKKNETVAYRLDGATGLIMEGEWYMRKISPDWGGAGLRDVVYAGKDEANKMHRLPVIIEEEEERNVPVPLFDPSAPERVPLQYAGVDASYFSVVLIPEKSQLEAHPSDYIFAKGYARVVAGVMEKRLHSRTDVSTRLISQTIDIKPGESMTRKFTVFAGPKDPEVLEEYGLRNILVYGWFGPVAKLMLMILGFFNMIVHNYGLSIIMLTVLVRGLMLPMGRKQARNAQKMQELAPEMKKIAEKYKKDMEKRAKAQQELFKKHNYNPLAGCGVMFVQLPVFIGLYRALSVSIDLRQASLIPGLKWCSNLAGPDMAWYWANLLPEFLAGETGWLGPYLNILPLMTIALFIVHQKLFMPPATDEQQQMQQNMMKYMMIFMGVMFFKVASGLCLYFIASSLWGIAERKLLPKAKPTEQTKEDQAALVKSDPNDKNGAAAKKKARRKQKKK